MFTFYSYGKKMSIVSLLSREIVAKNRRCKGSAGLINYDHSHCTVALVGMMAI